MTRKPAQVNTALPSLRARPVAERAAEGKALRQRSPRTAHATYEPPADRADPIEILIASNEGRDPDLVPIRHGRMLASSFAFYRGAAAIMASDLAGTPTTGVMLQACGDAHLLNFGGFATPERRIVFDINDFDETSIAPWEWDVKRLVASFVLAARSNGFDEDAGREAARSAAQSYRERMAAYGAMPILDAWYSYLDLESLVESAKDQQAAAYYRRRIKLATEQSAHEKEFARLTFQEGASPRIKDDPPLIFHTEITEGRFRRNAEKGLARYAASLPPERRVLVERFEPVDAAIKVVGVGSVGTFCAIVLLMAGNGDPLFLQLKEARESVLEPFAGAAPFDHHGERVVAGQRLMQSASDIFLGWFTGLEGGEFYVRQLRDAKIKPVVETMTAQNLVGYARTCGWALARAHARSTDAVALTGYLGKSSAFENALAGFAVAYADQTERDHQAMIEAVREGRLEVRTET